MNRELITEDWCWQVYADREAQIMEANWLEQASLQGQEFMNYLEKWCDLIESNQPRGFLVDSRKGHVVMTPDIQEWHDHTIVPCYINAGVKKVAFILPEDIFEATSVEQTFEEAQASHDLQTQFFDDIDEARIWLYGN
ncbi:MAG: hypothetical protein MUE85_17015 [Microscillaceae bacterium]|jgi:hypothetical protein|nr:hypothetical protein [Microscillaceae bacterium]